MPKRHHSAVRDQSSRRESAAARDQKLGGSDTQGSLQVDAVLQWVATAAILVLFGVVSVQPISSDDLWWQLSCGRQMFSTGTLWPSVELLAHESRGEANGLGAAAVAAVYWILGAGGLMSVRVIAVATVGWLIIRRIRQQLSAGSTVSAMWACLISLLAAVALAPWFDPLPMLFDFVALGGLAALQNAQLNSQARALTAADSQTPQDSLQSSFQRIKFDGAIIATLFLMWANFGDYAVVGLALLLIAALAAALRAFVWRPAAVDAATPWIWLGIGFLAGCLNPIGLRMWWDSFAQAVPLAVAPAWALVATDWMPLAQARWTTPAVLFVLLSVAWLARHCLLQRRFVENQHGSMVDRATAVARLGAATRLPQMALIQLLVWSSAATLPLGIAWLWSDWLSAGAATSPPSGQRSLSKYPRAQRLVWTTVLLTTLLIAANGLVRSAGWGINARLDSRYLQLALMNVRDAGTVFADDVRSAGMVAWVLGPALGANTAGGSSVGAPAGGSGGDAGGSLRLQDEPRRALIGGRLGSDRRLLNDLREGRQMRYWRADATAGGWWLELTRRDTSLLVFSRRDFALIRRLEPSIWKPLSLDSPALPYARAGDPAYSTRIIEILSQRETIDQRPWAYELPTSSGSAYDRDGWGLLPGRSDPSMAFHQAEVFAAMELRIASLRVLSVAIDRWPGDVRMKRLWRRCQRELADQERLLVGRPSLMRSLAAGEGVPASLRENAIERTQWDELVSLIATYQKQGAAVAMAQATQLSNFTDEMRYAIICWAIEAGRYHEALQQMAAMAAEQPVSPELDLLMRHHRDQLSWLTQTRPTAN